MIQGAMFWKGKCQLDVWFFLIFKQFDGVWS